MRQRVATYPTSTAAIVAGQDAMLLVDDLAWGVVQIFPGRALGSMNYDSLEDQNQVDVNFDFPVLDQLVPSNFNRSFIRIPSHFVKLGELRFMGGSTVTFFPQTPNDGLKRNDT